MSIQYKISTTFRPGQGKEGEQIWFPKLTGSNHLDLREVAGILAQRSTASEADVYLIIMGLVDLIPELLTKGYTVKLDSLGSFRLHARVETHDSPDKVTVRDIKEIRLSFTPDKRIKKLLQQAKVVKQSKKKK